MTKKTKVVLGVVGGIILIAAIAGSGNKSNTQTVPNSNANNTSQPAAQQEPAQEKMTISNSTYSDANGMKQVVGEVTNNDSGKHSATIKATFYDASGKIMGTATGAVNDVAPSETKTFTLLTMDEVTGHANMKVQIDTLL